MAFSPGVVPWNKGVTGLPKTDAQLRHLEKLHAGNLGMRRSDEARARMSAFQKGREKTLEHRERIRETLIGRKLPKEHRENISRGLTRYLESIGVTQRVVVLERYRDYREAQALLPSLKGYECVYCGAPARHRDHVVPWAQGGRATPGNIVPACHRCNVSKSARTPEQWLAAGLIAEVL